MANEYNQTIKYITIIKNKITEIEFALYECNNMIEEMQNNEPRVCKILEININDAINNLTNLIETSKKLINSLNTNNETEIIIQKLNEKLNRCENEKNNLAYIFTMHVYQINQLNEHDLPNQNNHNNQSNQINEFNKLYRINQITDEKNNYEEVSAEEEKNAVYEIGGDDSIHTDFRSATMERNEINDYDIFQAKINIMKIDTERYNSDRIKMENNVAKAKAEKYKNERLEMKINALMCETETGTGTETRAEADDEFPNMMNNKNHNKKMMIKKILNDMFSKLNKFKTNIEHLADFIFPGMDDSPMSDGEIKDMVQYVIENIGPVESAANAYVKTLIRMRNNVSEMFGITIHDDVYHDGTNHNNAIHNDIDEKFPE